MVFFKHIEKNKLSSLKFFMIQFNYIGSYIDYIVFKDKKHMFDVFQGKNMLKFEILRSKI